MTIMKNDMESDHPLETYAKSENRHSDNEYFVKLRSVMIEKVPVIPVKDLD